VSVTSRRPKCSSSCGRGPEHWTIRDDGTIGRLALVVPRAGRAVATLGRPWVRFALVTLAGVLLGGMLLQRIWGT
jgi:hypothetical protein